MSLANVRDVLRSFDGMSDDAPLDARACVMTVGDLRMLVKCAEDVAIRHANDNWPEIMGASVRGRAP